jgi:hypothetical protein
LPAAISPVDGWNLTHVSNPLLLPVVDFSKPSLRATNAGFQVVTHEFDGEEKEQFEETLRWSLPSGPFSQLDEELRKYHDYRGYCIVFADRRSLHLNFLFDARLLKNAPSDADFASREAEQTAYNAIMLKAYIVYWEFVHGLIQKILKPSIQSDPRMNSMVRWRRTPHGIRRLEKPSPILNLPVGAKAPDRHSGKHQDESRKGQQSLHRSGRILGSESVTFAGCSLPIRTFCTES